ncbi:MAG: NAD(P)-dependent oxidoreductase [Rhodospirillales bacterium]
MAALTGQSVALIGLGLMGRPMAKNLLAAGADLVVANRSPGPVQELVALGARAADDFADAASGADIIILMLADTPVVEAVTMAMEPGLRSGQLVIDMGTTAVMATRRLADHVALKGVAWLDAPVSGGQIGAVEGTMTIMAGGEQRDFDRAGPVLDVLGSRRTLVGPVGCGQVAKAANQVIVGLTIGAVSEALALAAHAGADPAKVREALAGGFAASRILDVHGQRMIEGAFAPGGKATTQRKDMDQALDLAEAVGLHLPATQMSRDLYDRLIAAGFGGLDHSALFKVIDEGL